MLSLSGIRKSLMGLGLLLGVLAFAPQVKADESAAAAGKRGGVSAAS